MDSNPRFFQVPRLTQKREPNFMKKFFIILEEIPDFFPLSYSPFIFSKFRLTKQILIS